MQENLSAAGSLSYAQLVELTVPSDPLTGGEPPPKNLTPLLSFQSWGFGPSGLAAGPGPFHFSQFKLCFIYYTRVM